MNGRTNSGLAKGGFAFVISAVLLVLTIIMVADSFSIDSLIQDPLIIYVCAVGGFVSGVYAVWVNLRFHKQNANDSRNSWLSFALFCFSLLVLGWADRTWGFRGRSPPARNCGNRKGTSGFGVANDGRKARSS